MSAWYLWGSTDMYPLNPTTPRYLLYVPYVPHLCISMENGRVLEVHRTLACST